MTIKRKGKRGTGFTKGPTMTTMALEIMSWIALRTLALILSLSLSLSWLIAFLLLQNRPQCHITHFQNDLFPWTRFWIIGFRCEVWIINEKWNWWSQWTSHRFAGYKTRFMLVCIICMKVLVVVSELETSHAFSLVHLSPLWHDGPPH